MTDQIARTAGEEDHSYPHKYAGEKADAPVNPRRSSRLFKKIRGLFSEPVEVPRKALPWRNCNASLRLVEGINAKWPARDKASDGTIGDAAHATRSSDHNPWVIVGAYGVVRARDVDKDGIDAAWVVEELRKLGAAGDPRLTGGGYIIFNRRITSPDFSTWNVYTGTNPHTMHFHVSFSRNVAGFDSNAPWTFLTGQPVPPPPPPPPTPWLSLPPVRTRPRSFQRWYNAYPFRPALLPIISPLADNWGPQSEAALRKVQSRYGLVPDGIDGPKTKKLLWDLGWRG